METIPRKSSKFPLQPEKWLEPCARTHTHTRFQFAVQLHSSASAQLALHRKTTAEKQTRAQNGNDSLNCNWMDRAHFNWIAHDQYFSNPFLESSFGSFPTQSASTMAWHCSMHGGLSVCAPRVCVCVCLYSLCKIQMAVDKEKCVVCVGVVQATYEYE